MSKRKKTYYNDNSAYCCDWLSNLIDAGIFPPGVIDDRSIRDIQPEDLKGYTRVHFFAGIGGWELALWLAGWGEDREVWTGSCPCFVADTLVLTNDGFKPIQDIKVGDEVLTHKNRFKKVTAWGSEISNTVVVTGYGHYGIECTPNHPFYTRNKEGEHEWVPAKDMEGLYWGSSSEINYRIPYPHLEPDKSRVVFDKSVSRWKARGEKGGKRINLGNHDTWQEAMATRREAVKTGKIDVRGADGVVDVMDSRFAFFLGYWLGDGWVSGDTVLLCGSKNDAHILNILFKEVGLKGTAYQERTGTRIRCGSKYLSTWLTKEFGEGAKNKKIPGWIFTAPEEYKKAFLDGYFLADGHYDRTDKAYTTTSKNIALGVKNIALSLGHGTSLQKKEVDSKKTIEGRTVNQSSYYRVTTYEKARKIKFADGHGWGKVRRVSEGRKAIRVYNLAVEGDESYVADGIVVHNCQPFSSAGRKQGAADERHLWPAFFHLISKCNPATIFGEQVESPLGREWFTAVRLDLETIGYVCGGADLPASSIGAPHTRQRLFWVAHDPSSRWVKEQSKPRRGTKRSRKEFLGKRPLDSSILLDSRPMADSGCEQERSRETRENLGEHERPQEADVHDSRRSEDIGDGGRGVGNPQEVKQREQANRGDVRKESRRTNSRDGDGGRGVDNPPSKRTDIKEATIEEGNKRVSGKAGSGNGSKDGTRTVGNPASERRESTSKRQGRKSGESTSRGNMADSASDSRGGHSGDIPVEGLQQAQELPDGPPSGSTSSGMGESDSTRLEGSHERQGRNSGKGSTSTGTGELADPRGKSTQNELQENAKAGVKEEGEGASDGLGRFGDLVHEGWGEVVYIPCFDGKARPIKSGVLPLANGLPLGMGNLSPAQRQLAELAGLNSKDLQEAKSYRVRTIQGYGNAIVPQVAGKFIISFMEADKQ